MNRTKITRVGNSAGVILSRDLLHALGLKVGSLVNVTVDEEHQALILARARSGKHLPIDPKFASRVEDFIRRYKPALRRLAK